ncbi:MAG: hypothetical protein Q7K21_06940 [Elusimicrobiota bacterium]|nr:hypothetical protein [Elusimicrobiota bacterium]
MMPTKSKIILKEFTQKCNDHLSSVKIPTKIGKHKIELSSRTISDVIEKHTINFMIDYFGEDKAKKEGNDQYDAFCTENAWAPLCDNCAVEYIKKGD